MVWNVYWCVLVCIGGQFVLTNLSLQVFADKYVADEDEIEILEVVAAPRESEKITRGLTARVQLEEAVDDEDELDARLGELFSEQRAALDAEIGFLNAELQAARAAEKLGAEKACVADTVPKEEGPVWVDCDPDQLYDVLAVDPVPSDTAIERGLQNWKQLGDVFNIV